MLRSGVFCREEDKLILQRCLHIQAQREGGDSCFRDIAEQLNKRPEQVGCQVSGKSVAET